MRIKKMYGAGAFSSDFDDMPVDAEYEAFRAATPVDFYQQGLNQEYAAQIQLESMMGEF
jgi:hypothetical protein